MLSMLWSSLSALPVLVKVLVTLALILLANRLVKELLVSVLAGTLLLGLWFGHGLPDVGVIAWERFRSPDNLLLIAVLLLVIWLSSLMAEGGVMRDLVEAVRSRVPRRLAFAALPGGSEGDPALSRGQEGPAHQGHQPFQRGAGVQTSPSSRLTPAPCPTAPGRSGWRRGTAWAG
jgi:hypothetical protein